MSINKISKQALYLLVVASLCITACKKDPSAKPEETEQTKKLIKVSEDAANYSTFEYDANGNLSKMLQAFGDEGDPGTLEVAYTYNAQKKATGFTIPGVINCKYIYTNNKITKAEWYSENVLGAYDVLSYTGDKLTKVEKYFRGANATFSLDSKSDYSYLENGNIKEIKNFIINDAGQPEHTFTRQFLQYDTKKSPFKSFSEPNIGLIIDFMSVNNITRVKNQNADGTIVLDTEISYTYNAEGYPLTSATKSTENGVVTNSNSTFTYQ